jgi:hypothetical protein
MARGPGARASPTTGRACAAAAVDLDELQGEYDEEEDGVDGSSDDVSVKSEPEDGDAESLLEDLRAAGGDGGARSAPPHDKLGDDPVRLLQAFVPLQMTEKATMTVVKFMIEHLRETLVSTGARVAALGEDDFRTSMQLAGIMIVRLAGFTSQSPSELVSAAAVRAGTPMPCKTSVQGATALKALREIVSEHMVGRCWRGCRGRWRGSWHEWQQHNPGPSGGARRGRLGYARFCPG